MRSASTKLGCAAKTGAGSRNQAERKGGRRRAEALHRAFAFHKRGMGRNRGGQTQEHNGFLGDRLCL